MEQLTRRSLLTAAAAAAAIGTAAPRALAIAAPSARQEVDRSPRRKPRKALKWYMIADGTTVADKFAIARDCGFDGVELDSPSELDLEAVLAAKQQTGIETPGVVDSVHWQKPLSAADAAERAEGVAALERALRDARAYGATSVLLVPAVVQKDVMYGDAWTRSQAEIRKVLPLAAELAIDLLIENVWNGFLLGPTELARYVDELEHPNTGVHFDAGNLVRFGFPHHWVPILGARIKKVDVKDFVRSKNSFDVLLNDGDTDWPLVMRELRAIHYDGWFTAEMKAGNRAYLTDLGKRMDGFLAG